MKIVKYLGIFLLIAGALYATAFFIKSNSKSAITYETETMIKATIEEKTVATGKVVPEDEVEIKPQISGIIEKILVEEGDKVRTGDLLARIKVVPNEQSLNAASGRVKTAQIVLKNAQTEFNRSKALFDRGVISEQDYNSVLLRFNQAKQDLSNAQSDLQIIRLGSAGGSSTANTNIRATVSGTILEIPIKEGDQVIQSNNFNAGTTIATIADLQKMIFEGKVDEAEVGKLVSGMPLKVSLGAIQDKDYDAKLKFIAPKGTEEQGAIQFKIEADVFLDDEFFVRAGYSANASIVLQRKDSVPALREALLQFDKKTQKPFVEIAVGEQKFERKDVELGISDGVNVEVVSGITEEDKVKVWNKTEPLKRDTEENEE